MCAVGLVRGGGGAVVRANFGRIARRPPPTVHSTPVTPTARRGGRWLAAAVSRLHTLQAGGGRRAGGASGSGPAGGGAAPPPESTSDSTPRPLRSLYTRSETGDRRRGLGYIRHWRCPQPVSFLQAIATRRARRLRHAPSHLAVVRPAVTPTPFVLYTCTLTLRHGRQEGRALGAVYRH